MHAYQVVDHFNTAFKDFLIESQSGTINFACACSQSQPPDCPICKNRGFYLEERHHETFTFFRKKVTVQTLEWACNCNWKIYNYLQKHRTAICPKCQNKKVVTVPAITNVYRFSIQKIDGETYHFHSEKDFDDRRPTIEEHTQEFSWLLPIPGNEYIFTLLSSGDCFYNANLKTKEGVTIIDASTWKNQYIDPFGFVMDPETRVRATTMNSFGRKEERSPIMYGAPIVVDKEETTIIKRSNPSIEEVKEGFWLKGDFHFNHCLILLRMGMMCNSVEPEGYQVFLRDIASYWW